MSKSDVAEGENDRESKLTFRFSEDVAESVRQVLLSRGLLLTLCFRFP